MSKSTKMLVIALIIVVGIITIGYFATRQFKKEKNISQQSSQLAIEKMLDPINGQTVGGKVPKTNPFEVDINPFDAYKNPFNK